jgi:hypothetical protein
MLPDRIRPLTETVKECWLLCARQRQLSNAVSGCVSTTQLPFSWEAQSLIWLVLLIPLGHVALLLCVQYEHRLVVMTCAFFSDPAACWTLYFQDKCVGVGAGPLCHPTA